MNTHYIAGCPQLVKINLKWKGGIGQLVKIYLSKIKFSKVAKYSQVFTPLFNPMECFMLLQDIRNTEDLMYIRKYVALETA